VNRKKKANAPRSEEENDRLRAEALNRALTAACLGFYDREALKALLAAHRELCAAVEALIRGSET
jgi:hypothetical protein